MDCKVLVGLIVFTLVTQLGICSRRRTNYLSDNNSEREETLPSEDQRILQNRPSPLANTSESPDVKDEASSNSVEAKDKFVSDVQETNISNKDISPCIRRKNKRLKKKRKGRKNRRKGDLSRTDNHGDSDRYILESEHGPFDKDRDMERQKDTQNISWPPDKMEKLETVSSGTDIVASGDVPSTVIPGLMTDRPLLKTRPVSLCRGSSKKGQGNCQKWVNCQNPLLRSQTANIKTLPSCPCLYPMKQSSSEDSDTLTTVTVWDDHLHQLVTWLEASSKEDKIQVYKPGAKFCIRSSLILDGGHFGSQQCCYDEGKKLVTRGRDAGTPQLVSPDLSRELHHKVDVLPWIVCNGDWTMYNSARPPNNRRKCPENPLIEEFQVQMKQAKDF